MNPYLSRVFKEQGRRAEHNRCWRNHLRRHYGLTPEQHRKMYDEQGGRCALCHAPVSYEKIQIDHDRVTERIRGLVCNKCNHAIGTLENYQGKIADLLAWITRGKGTTIVRDH